MKKSAVMNTLKKKIREHKYKFTTQRQVILQAFLESKENHMCAEDVYEFVRDNNPEIGLATVYRSLELFTSLELLKKLDFGDGRSRYELNDHKENGFAIVDYQLKFYGYCADCERNDKTDK